MENWLKSVSAFANGTGGVLVFGKAEDGTVAGVRDMDTASEIIRTKIKECIVPSPQIALKTRRSNGGKELLLLEVSPGKELPYFYHDGGKMQAYIRVGKENILLGTAELKRMILRSEDISYDSVETGYDAKDFSFSELVVSFQEWTGDIIGGEELESFGLIKNEKLTIAGLLFADYSPVSYSRLRCIRWNGLDKSGGRKNISDSALYTGNLFTLLNKGIWFIKQNMKVLWSESDGKKTELPDYCDAGIFEGLVNALAHRDYLITKSEIRIDMYDDRLTISSPGGMPDGSRIQDKIKAQVHPSARNPVLTRVFTLIGYMEQEGTGLSKIQNTYRNAPGYTPKKLPGYYSDTGQFTITLKNLNYQNLQDTKAVSVEKHIQEKNITVQKPAGINRSRIPSENTVLSQNEKKVLSVVKEQPDISTDNISRQTEIAKRTVERTLQSLKKKGIVTREGSRRSGIWIVNT